MSLRSVVLSEDMSELPMEEASAAQHAAAPVSSVLPRTRGRRDCLYVGHAGDSGTVHGICRSDGRMSSRRMRVHNRSELLRLDDFPGT